MKNDKTTQSENSQLLAKIQEKDHEIQRLKNELEETNRGVVALYTDVEKKTQDLKIANQDLESFSNAIAYYLSTPLRHINTSMEMLNKNIYSSLSKENQQHFEQISTATKRALNMVNDLLHFSRANQHELQKEQVNLNGIMIECIKELEPESQDRTIEWKISSLPEVECDRGMMRLVFNNLIGNALKFTKNCTRTVIEIGTEDNENQNIIYIHDNGVGFDNQYAAKLFGMFTKLHHDIEFEGTGIGLANVRQIIQKHGGNIWAKGEVDKGSIFYVALPKLKI